MASVLRISDLEESLSAAMCKKLGQFHPPRARKMSRISGLADMKKAAAGGDDKKKKQNTLYTGGALS